MALALSVVALLLAVAALGTALPVALRGHVRGRTAADEPVPADVAALRDEVEALRADSVLAFRRLAVVRYDAFGDMGGGMSWSVALLDDAGDGVLLSSIHGRSDSRSYAKNVTAWASDQQLSPEEAEAIQAARQDA